MLMNGIMELLKLQKPALTIAIVAFALLFVLLLMLVAYDIIKFTVSYYENKYKRL